MRHLLSLLLISTSLFLVACQKQSEQAISKKFSVGIFITGVVAGNPPYEMMANAALNLEKEQDMLSVKVFEAGYNQAEWEEKLTSFVASGEYDVIVATNPALPELCDQVGKQFPNQKFIITDAYYIGNENIATYLFNQYEQSYVLGYAAALISKDQTLSTIPSTKLGFLVAQEFPLITKHVIPGFLNGAREVDAQFEVDYRIIGNWYDANKASDLANSMMESGVNAMGIIAGGASLGAIKAANEASKYIVFHNTIEFDKAPGTILVCGLMQQELLTRELILMAMDEKIVYGKAETLGVREGYIDFEIDSSNNIPKHIRDDINRVIDELKSGKLMLETPSL